jgi:hypothetical protein
VITEAIIKAAYPNFRPYDPEKPDNTAHYFMEFVYHYNRGKEKFEPSWNITDKQSKLHLQLYLEGLTEDRFKDY